MWSAIGTFLRTWGIVVLLIAGGVAIAYRFVAPAPPATLRLASGPGAESAYGRTIARYAGALRREDFRIELVETQGSVENLALLERGEVDFALVQGGVADIARHGDLVSLGATFFEPLWVFVRRDGGRERLQQLTGGRVAVGPEGSGTRALAFALLEANAVRADAINALPLSGLDAAEAVLAGEADAAVFVAAVPGEGISRLMRAPDQAVLVDFTSRAAAYARVLPFLTPVVLPRSGISLPEDLPAADVTLLAPAAALLAREDVHPQLVNLLLRIMAEEHGGRQAFAPEGRFPSPLGQDVRLHPDARRWYERGPTFLQSWLPFWVAVTVERLWVLLIPLLTLALPLIRFAPPIYTWQMESRIYRHYDDLRRIEEEAAGAAGDRRARDALADRLSTLEAKVARIGVPASYGRQVFALRRDIAHVRAMVGEGRAVRRG